MQDVAGTNLIFSYNFLGLAAATSTYGITGVRLVSTGSGTALGIRLDGTTGVQSIDNTDPLFANGDVVGLTFNNPNAPFPPISFDNFYNANDGSTL